MPKLATSDKLKVNAEMRNNEEKEDLSYWTVGLDFHVVVLFLRPTMALD